MFSFYCLLLYYTAPLCLCFCDVTVSNCCCSLCLFQCMRNPALLQRTGLVIRVLCHIQENVWLLRWKLCWWRHHGQLLGGKNTLSCLFGWVFNSQHSPSYTSCLVSIWPVRSSRLTTEHWKWVIKVDVNVFSIFNIFNLTHRTVNMCISYNDKQAFILFY